MPYLALAVGVVLAAIGAILVATGFPIIQVERGWATVIAGSTLLSGGVITAALGLVLRALDALRTGTPAHAVSVAEPILPISDSLAQTPSSSAPLVAVAAATPSELSMPTKAPPAMAEAAEMHLEPEPEAKQHIPEAVALAGISDHDVPEPSHASLGQPDEDTIPLPLDLAETKHGPTAPTAVEPVTSGDWLDQSFADFDRENADFASRAPTEPDLPPEPEPSPEQVPVASEPTVAVIGRYEADGTSYVMYADGSIEAQSPAGIYRFSSMAELKAFIEG